MTSDPAPTAYVESRILAIAFGYCGAAARALPDVLQVAVGMGESGQGFAASTCGFEGEAVDLFYGGVAEQDGGAGRVDA